VLEAAGLPPGVINFLPGRASKVGDPVLAHPDLAGIHFTGSTPVFQQMWKTLGDNIASYRSYPRIVGETGGKNFVLAHVSADPAALATALVRGAFEYQGQKCSAASRAYVPRSLWGDVKRRLEETVGAIRMGSPADFGNFMAAVIDENSFDRIMEYVDYAKGVAEAEILTGGNGDKSRGYFVEPTIVLTKDPHFRLMKHEIFGPVLTVYVYEDGALDQAIELA